MKPVARLVLAVFALISLVLPQGPAFAQAAPQESQAAATAYQEALALYAAGDLKGALASMRLSHRLSQRAELLYNIARLESELGDCAASLADYRLYMEQVPDGRYRSDAERATRDLAQRCPDTAPSPTPSSEPSVSSASASVEPEAPPVASQTAEPPQPALPPPAPTRLEPPSYWTAPRWIGWSLVAASTVAGVGAVYFTAAALDSRSSFKSSVDVAAQGGPLPDFSLQDRQHRQQHWAQALYVASGALLAGGVVVLVVAPTKASVKGSSARLYLEPGLLAADFTARF